MGRRCCPSFSRNPTAGPSLNGLRSSVPWFPPYCWKPKYGPHCSGPGQSYNPNWLSDFEWIYPDRPISAEIEAALNVRYLRSGDLLHVATALYATHTRYPALAFITLDNNQREAAAGLGFITQ